MQIFSCPFCGPRPEYEFHFGGELGNRRPEGGSAVPGAEWANYLHFRSNPKGQTDEVWLHTPCGELFSMRRDTVTMAAELGRPFAKEGESE